MIKGVIIVNNLGVVRLAKFYEQVHVTGESAEQAQQSVIKKIYRAVSKRQDNQCNYLEGSIPEWGGDTKLIYRHYATLYFVFACTNLSLLTSSGPKKTQIGARPGTLSSGYQ